MLLFIVSGQLLFSVKQLSRNACIWICITLYSILWVPIFIVKSFQFSLKAVVSVTDIVLRFAA